jgi:hypothetical protein
VQYLARTSAGLSLSQGDARFRHPTSDCGPMRAQTQMSIIRPDAIHPSPEAAAACWGKPSAGRPRLEQLAADYKLDLARSHAYGDARGDRWMLECVGHPAAVNPSAALARLARQRGWRVLQWESPQEGRIFIEQFVLPTLELCKKLLEEKKILAGGPVGGAIALALVIEAESVQELDGYGRGWKQP